MNLLFSPELWSDGGSSPPIYWNASEQRYEVLVASENGAAGLILETTEGASAGDTIEFTYDVDGFFNTEPGGAGDYTFRLVRSGSENVLWSVQMSDAPVSGEVSVDCEEGAQYQFEVYRDGGFGFSLYDFEAIITPTGSPDPEPAACFWTDIVNATQECGGDVGGQWVPLHMAGIAYDLNVMGGEGSIAGSTVTIDTEYFEGSVWGLTMEGFDGEIRLRVTPLSFTATGGDDGGGIYTPATLDVETGNDGYYQIGNQAPPYPATNFPPFVPEQVGSWENSMLSDIRAEGYLYFNYHIGRCNGDGAPMHEQGQFLVEIWTG